METLHSAPNLPPDAYYGAANDQPPNYDVMPAIETVPGTLPMDDFEQSFYGPDAIPPTPETTDREPITLNNRFIRDLGDRLVAGEAIDNETLLEAKRLLDANAERDANDEVVKGPDGMPWRFRGQIDEKTGKPSPLSQRSARAVYSAGEALETQIREAEEKNQPAEVSAESIAKAAQASEEKDSEQSRSASLEQARAINDARMSVQEVIQQIQTQQAEAQPPPQETTPAKVVDENKNESETEKDKQQKPTLQEAIKSPQKQNVEHVIDNLKNPPNNQLQKAEINKSLESLSRSEKEAVVEQIATDALAHDLVDINIESLEPGDIQATTQALDKFLFEHTTASFTAYPAVNDIYIKAFSKILSSLKPEVKQAYLYESQHPFFKDEHATYPTVVAPEKIGGIALRLAQFA